MLGEQAQRISADAEEGSVAERDDTGVAEDQVERQRQNSAVIAIWLASER